MKQDDEQLADHENWWKQELLQIDMTEEQAVRHMRHYQAGTLLEFPEVPNAIDYFNHFVRGNKPDPREWTARKTFPCEFARSYISAALWCRHRMEPFGEEQMQSMCPNIHTHHVNQPNLCQ
ncbi:MAG: hypothetical protein R3C18_23375 [Planctomycetaceae bacterium]